jgi:quinol monooxygenase YgiN
MPQIAVIGTIRFPPERVREALPHLRTLVEATRQNDGCIAYDVAEDPFDPGLIRFSELWPDRASLDRHLAAPHIEPWRTAARACGLGERSFTAYEVVAAGPV